jgi:hypothetical protein
VKMFEHDLNFTSDDDAETVSSGAMLLLAVAVNRHQRPRRGSGTPQGGTRVGSLARSVMARPSI